MAPPALPTPVRVLVVEDDSVTRKTLSLSIESAPSLHLLQTFDSVKPALAWMETAQFDVLLTDLGLPDGSGIELIHACRALHPACDIMVLTTSSNEADVVASIEAGASSYLVKGMHKNDIVDAIMTLREGGAPMSPGIARMVIDRLRVGGKPAAGDDARQAGSLTKREIATLDLIAEGNSYIETAKILHVSVGTVQTHIKSIYNKLSVHSRSAAVFEAQRRGLLKRSPSREILDEGG